MTEKSINEAQLVAAYCLISELFLYPEDRDEMRIDAEMERLHDAPAGLRAPLQEFLAAPAAANTGEYVSTLELAPLAPLYIGAYLYDEPTSCRGAGMSGRNGYMVELSNIYRHFGVELDSGELADFVPIIVEFLAISLERQDEDRIGLRRYFVEGSLINGVEALLSKLRKVESPYAHLVESLRVALTADIAQMAGGPKWQPQPEDKSRRPSATTCGVSVNDFTGAEKGAEL